MPPVKRYVVSPQGRAFAVLAVLLAATNEVNRTRGDFCIWASVHVATFPQHPTPEQERDLRADIQLVRLLGCH